MIGKPKYKLGDRVKFDVSGRRYHGNIYIIDAYGTFEDESDVSYDIMVHEWGPKKEDCLFDRGRNAHVYRLRRGRFFAKR